MESGKWKIRDEMNKKRSFIVSYFEKSYNFKFSIFHFPFNKGKDKNHEN